jgi:hypothetical protein
MSIGWFDDLDDAQDYFDTERLDASAWDALDDDKKQENVLTMAYNRIFYSSAYTVPTYAAASAAQLVVLKKVNGEMAYYLCVHLNDEDKRKGIQAQGVLEAGIVKEVYDRDMLKELPIPPMVHSMLVAGGFLASQSFFGVDLTRDEDEDIN